MSTNIPLYQIFRMFNIELELAENNSDLTELNMEQFNGLYYRFDYKKTSRWM
jgi:TATA-box binding protein (TBP) (component of TFIID and TFIIIB)